MLEPRPMEIVEHNLECKCNRRREWIEVDGEFTPIEFSVKDPNEPPMTEEEKTKIAKLIKESMNNKSTTHN
ncbi:TPA: hypothetical protein VBN14_001747 [Streptococcus agalactiae]|nr:hypothetical protein [Streptococcus agalactiae]HEO7923680.1 hypothetical protein [Streptococcus agalactiae]